MIGIDRYFAALRAVNNGELPLDENQRKAMKYGNTNPLWIIAGPGTGKTHTLIWLCLKRILVDGVYPERIILTTFTRKAAVELESRLIRARQSLITSGLTDAEAIDVSQIQVGTLHALCVQILQEQRYEPTLRIRVLEDELTQQFFIRQSLNPLINCDDIMFWQHFGLAGNNPQYPPNKAKRAEGAAKLFNRMTENGVDVDAMLACHDPDFGQLAAAYQRYEHNLQEKHRTDQAHLQKHFLEFLQTPKGMEWLNHGFTVLVDEYQDTNPIQEQIYFQLAGAAGDLTVVGDDDQSLYRFRGATVEALVEFDHACEIFLNKVPTPIYLYENRRSHPEIVRWVNRFIEYHPDMTDPTVRVRAPHKPALAPRSQINGSYPAVMAIAERANPAAAQKVTTLINQLMTDGYVQDYSQIAILSFSTRETSRSIGTFTGSLRNSGIPLYNPRSGRAQNDEIVLALVGALGRMLDPEFDASTLPGNLPGSVPRYIQQARHEFDTRVASGYYPDLRNYIDKSIRAIRTSKLSQDDRTYLTRQGGLRVTISGLVYKLLSFEPFASMLKDPEVGERLKAFNMVLAEYESLYNDGELRIDMSSTGSVQIHRRTLYNFYSVFIEGIHDHLNDPEDDEISVQRGAVNVMTIHQSKGLEFEVVFLLRPDKGPWMGDTHILEDLLDPFNTRPTQPKKRRSRESRAFEDYVRLFFVGYSRAKRLLILTGSGVLDWDRALGRTEDGQAINSIPALTSAGVYIL